MRKQYTGERSVNIDAGWNYALLIAAATLFWAIGYVTSVGYPLLEAAAYTPVWSAIIQALPGKTIVYITGLLLLIGGAFIIHRANYTLIIIREKTYMPILLYLLFVSSNSFFLPLNPVYIGFFCLILAYYLILSGYGDRLSIARTYNAMFLIGLGSLLWIHILWFVPLFWWGMYTFKSLTSRTFLASLFGICTVYWFLLGYCVMTKSYSILLATFAPLAAIAPVVPSDLRVIDYLYISPPLVLALLAVANILIKAYEETIRTRRYLFFIILSGMYSFALAGLYSRQAAEFLQISCMPFAILDAHYICTTRRRRVHWVYFIFIIVFLLLSLVRAPWGELPAGVFD